MEAPERVWLVVDAHGRMGFGRATLADAEDDAAHDDKKYSFAAPHRVVELVRADLVPQVLAGWKLVPVEPTEAMLDALTDRMWNSHTVWTVWQAMLAAAPEPPGEKT